MCTNPTFTQHQNTLWLKEIGVSDSLWSMKVILSMSRQYRIKYSKCQDNTEYNTVEGVEVCPEEFSVWIEYIIIYLTHFHTLKNAKK